MALAAVFSLYKHDHKELKNPGFAFLVWSENIFKTELTGDCCLFKFPQCRVGRKHLMRNALPEGLHIRAKNKTKRWFRVCF